jgi:putative membrane protein
LSDIGQHLARQAEDVRDSAKTLERSAGAAVDSADRRTELAADRTVLAAERTYAAWVRTGLAALASGAGARALLVHILPNWFSALTGSMLIVFSAFCFAAAVWREVMRVANPTAPDAHRIPGWILVSLNGFLILVDILAVFGVWLART